MRTQAVTPDTMEVILRLLTPENSAVCRLCLAYGLRVGDVLALHTEQVHTDSTTIIEEKTGKHRKIVWSDQSRTWALAHCSKIWCFPGRCDSSRHRTRQAVYKDIRRACVALRLSGCVGTHSMRKSYAVRKYKACGDIRKIKALLCHSSEVVTMLYAMASEVDSRSK